MDLLPVVSPAVEDKPSRKRLPHWLRREIPSGFGYHATANIIDELGLKTVCESAKCPNRSECWSSRTATFMVMGDVCTRPCGFCSVDKGRTQPLEEDEPHRVAQAAARLGLAHVVITSVSRDDLPDGGAEHFYRCVLETRRVTGQVLKSSLLTSSTANQPSSGSLKQRQRFSITTLKQFHDCTKR